MAVEKKTLKHKSDVKFKTNLGFLKILNCGLRLCPWFVVSVIVFVKNNGKKKCTLMAIVTI